MSCAKESEALETARFAHDSAQIALDNAIWELLGASSNTEVRCSGVDEGSSATRYARCAEAVAAWLAAAEAVSQAKETLQTATDELRTAQDDYNSCVNNCPTWTWVASLKLG